ncbi:MAG: hypothetical protein Q8O37_06380 [Sulfuricellaceae bacterium]|nr:hypothetical protein [Sulfuricellaceae bacterium]
MKISQRLFHALALTCALAFATPACADEPIPNEKIKRRMARIAAIPATLQNPDFEEKSDTGLPSGWSGVVHAGNSYLVERDDAQAFSGKSCLSIKNMAIPEWGGANQVFQAGSLAGRDITISAQIKAQGVTANGFFIGLKILRTGHELGYFQTPDGSITGDTEWKKLDLSTKLPEDATHLELSLILHGDGKVWVDNLQIESR